jgi:hypothetical protein
MDKDNFEKRGSVVLRASGVELYTDFLSPDYQRPQVNSEANAGEREHLELFRIVPGCPGLPTFVGRIGHDDQDAVDVDLIGKEGEGSAFRSQAPGYVGHRTENLNTDPRSYKVRISTPEAGLVFIGTLTLNCLCLGKRVFDTFTVKDTAEPTVTKCANRRDGNN